MTDNDPGPIRVVLGRFEELVARGLTQILGEDRGIQIVGVGLDTARLERVVARKAPSIAILDQERVAQDALLRRLRRVRPTVALVVLAHHPSRAYRLQIMAAGAACVSTDSSAPQILATIRRVAGGEHAGGGKLLTPREVDVFEHLRYGRTVGEVADALGISIETVRTHIAHILSKFDVHSKHELIAMPALRPAQSGNRKVTKMRENFANW